MKKTTDAAKAADMKYEVEVLRAKEFDSGAVTFDLRVNGVTIYGMWYREYTNKEGEPGTMISYPATKGKDDKYYNIAWFPISLELKEEIIKQLEKLV